MKKHLIFDLDGTLIDSAPSILEGFAFAFSSLGMTPVKALTAEIIGPPLMQTLSILSASDDASLLQKLATQFKTYYDTQACKNAVVYPKITDLLASLKHQNYQLYIATNKRYLPTTKILQHLNWTSFFNGIYALDFFSPAISSKALLIERIIMDLKLNPDECIYIGDRYEDGLAADVNDVDFVMVTWGYADEASRSQKEQGWKECNNVDELMCCLNSKLPIQNLS